MRHRSARRTFTVDALEARRLLSQYAAYVQITSPLETNQANGDNSITVAPNQVVTFNVSVEGYMIGGGAGPAPTGTVNIFETYAYQGVTVGLEAGGYTQVTLSGSTALPGGAGTVATATGTVTLVNPNNSGSAYQAFVYADYLGDNNYYETYSSGSPPSNDGNVGNTVTVNFTAAANKLAFIQNPSNAAAGDTIAPPVTVEVEDANGNYQTSATDSVALSLASSSTGTGTLSGTTTEAAVGGLATFSNLSVSAAGSYPLTATDTTNAGTTAATSSTFTVTAGKLVFLAPPLATTQMAGKALQPTIKVELEDGSNNPITDEDGTVVTLSPIGSTSANPITGNTAPLAGGIATFSDVALTKAGTYQLQASDPDGDAMGTSNKFAVSGGTLTLTIASRSVHKATGVQTGDPVFYDLSVQSRKSIVSTAITDSLPAGFTPEDISAGGTFASGVITWNTADHDVSFEFIVPDAAALANLNAIVTTATATATYTDATTDDATATDTVKIAGSLKVTGNLHDVQFQFPAKNSLAEPALGGVPVQLVDPSDGTVIDQQTTAADGGFTLTAKLPGTYELLFTPIVQTYASSSNGYSSGTAYVGQSVTIPMGQTTPLKLGDLYLPRTFFTTASTILNALNNYATSGFQNLASFKIDLLKFDTTAPEGVVNGLLGSSASPTPLLNEKSLHIGGPADPWVAAMRSIAACATLNSRFTDMFRLTDQAGKILAVMASVASVKSLGQFQNNVLKQFPNLGSTASNALGAGFTLPFVSTATSKLVQGTRIAGFTALGAVLSPLLDAAGVSATNKNYVFAAVFNGLRYATDLFTGKLVDDLGFEVVFNVVRIAFDAELLGVLAGAQVRPDVPAPYSNLANIEQATDVTTADSLGSYQNAITATGSLSYNTDTDTSQVLSALDKYDGDEHDKYLAFQYATSVANSFGGLIKGADGAAGVYSRLGTLPATSFAGGLQSLVKQAATAVASEAELATGKALVRLSGEVGQVALASAAVGLIEESVGAGFVDNIAANGVLVGTSIVRPAAAVQPADIRPDADAIAAPAADVSASDVSAYLSDLDQLSRLVKTDDTAGIAAAYTTFAADDQTLFTDELLPLNDQANADLATIPASKRTPIATFENDLSAAVNQTGLANLQLAAWGSDPADGKASDVTAQLAVAAAAVKAVARDAIVVQALLSGKSVPASLVIDETSVPATAAAGSTQTFTVTVTNIGTETSAAGTVTFTNDDGGLVVQGPAEQPLAALDPDESATITYTVDVTPPADGDASLAYQIAVAAGGQTAALSDAVTLG
jgi:hypothetical protein